MSLQSRTGHTSMLGAVGMLVSTQYWSWFPLSHFRAVAFQPTAVIVPNRDLDRPVMDPKSSTKSSVLGFPPSLEQTTLNLEQSKDLREINLKTILSVLSELGASVMNHKPFSGNKMETDEFNNFFPKPEKNFEMIILKVEEGRADRRLKRRLANSNGEEECQSWKKLRYNWDRVDLLGSQVDGDPGDLSDDEKFANDSDSDDYTFANADEEDEEFDEEDSREIKHFYPLPSLTYKKVPVEQQKISSESQKLLPDCSAWCSENCTSVVKTWAASELLRIKDHFSGVKAVSLKNKLLNFLNHQKVAGLPMDGFFFNKQLLCVNFFCHISGISKYHANLVLNDSSRGILRYEHGNVSKSGCSTKSVTFICWLTRFIENFGQHGPSDIVIVIPSYLNKRELYKIYIQDAPTPHCRYSTFCRFMKQFFGPRRADKSLPWVRISKVSTHSKCDSCLGLDSYRRLCNTPAELEYCQALTDQHMKKYGNARIAVGNFIQRSLSNPKQVLSLQIDSMDNSKSIIPRVLEKSKGMTLMHRLACKITGVIVSSSLYTNNRKVKMFINHGIFMTKHSITALSYYIRVPKCTI